MLKCTERQCKIPEKMTELLFFFTQGAIKKHLPPPWFPLFFAYLWHLMVSDLKTKYIFDHFIYCKRKVMQQLTPCEKNIFVTLVT